MFNFFFISAEFAFDCMGAVVVDRIGQSAVSLMIGVRALAYFQMCESMTQLACFSVLRGFISLKSGKNAVLHLRFCTVADKPLRREKAR